MKNLKFILSVMLIACMLFSFGAVAFAEDADVATVVFEANEPDKDGYFTATLTVYNAQYLGLQGALYYNAEAVTPVSFETKEPTEEYKDAVRKTLCIHGLKHLILLRWKNYPKQFTDSI